jgi:hypothetical protein
MGVLGGLVYFLLFAKPAWILLTKRKNTANIYFATAIIVSLLLQFLNGRIYLTHYLVLGLVFPIINDGSITHIKI